MKNALGLALVSVPFLTASLFAGTISGTVVSKSGEPMEGVMVSAFDEDHQKSTSVFSQEDGSFVIDGLRDADHTLRARLLGMVDEWIDDVGADESDLSLTMTPAVGLELQEQRPANSTLSMLKFDSKKDKINFKMNCTGCHQAGTVGFRTPEKPVDWETMIRRMDGYGGLYKHTQETIVKRLLDTYSEEAVSKWPAYVPPPPPKGIETKVKITEWRLGKQFVSVIHDLELGPDGFVYGVDCHLESLQVLDPKTGERTQFKLKIGRSPHSIEQGNDGNLWMTHNISGEIGRFDPQTKEFAFASSAEAPARRGAYPHTLRINPEDPEGLIWYTDSGINSVYSMHPKTFFVKEYKLLSAVKLWVEVKENRSATRRTDSTILRSTG